MDLEQKLKAVQNQLNEIKSELEANKRKQEELKKRNWPERVEVGMLFRHKCGDNYIAMSATGMHPADTLVNLSSGCTFRLHNLFGSSEKQFTYLGHARDLIKITDDAHEPTGAELVGRRCEFSDDGKQWTETERNCSELLYTDNNGVIWKYARLK